MRSISPACGSQPPVRRSIGQGGHGALGCAERWNPPPLRPLKFDTANPKLSKGPPLQEATRVGSTECGTVGAGEGAADEHHV